MPPNSELVNRHYLATLGEDGNLLLAPLMEATAYLLQQPDAKITQRLFNNGIAAIGQAVIQRSIDPRELSLAMRQMMKLDGSVDSVSDRYDHNYTITGIMSLSERVRETLELNLSDQIMIELGCIDRDHCSPQRMAAYLRYFTNLWYTKYLAANRDQQEFPVKATGINLNAYFDPIIEILKVVEDRDDESMYVEKSRGKGCSSGKMREGDYFCSMIPHLLRKKRDVRQLDKATEAAFQELKDEFPTFYQQLVDEKIIIDCGFDEDGCEDGKESVYDWEL